MKKYFFIIIILTAVITSCERDDICIDDTTPNLIVRFYDKDNPTEFKSVSNLSVKVTSIENDSLNFSADSIAIPLKVTDNSIQYVLTANSTNGAELIRDTLSLNYMREEVFVGRSCGFKMTFNDLNITDRTSNWIQDFEIVNNTINSETEAHVKIFH